MTWTKYDIKRVLTLKTLTREKKRENVTRKETKKTVSVKEKGQGGECDRVKS